mmetsp:Transcript_1981/g.4210  ORF Transcript_1981/g.4210 Transcript_1981/m.4210 type:complete len:80 (+) Transcript_1981:892-1131(+)
MPFSRHHGGIPENPSGNNTPVLLRRRENATDQTRVPILFRDTNHPHPEREFRFASLSGGVAREHNTTQHHCTLHRDATV